MQTVAGMRAAAALIAGAWVFLPQQAPASALGDLATQMGAGEWRELSTQNIDPTLLGTGASGIEIGYSDEIVWDPVSRQLFFLGGDHVDQPQFINYKESTNTWQRLARESWMDVTTTPMHGYDHAAIDPVGRFYYYRPYGSMTLHRYDITAGTWSDLPSISSSVMGYVNCCVGVEWFPERNALIYASVESGILGSVIEYVSGTWRRLAPTPTLLMGEYHNFARYNPVHKVVFFGGGNGVNTRKIYSLNASGQVTALRDAPIPLGIMQSVITVDTVGGDFLVFGNDESFYSYNVATDTWTQQNASAVPIFTTSYGIPVYGIVATAISNYAVNLFIRCNGANDCRVFLYKYAPGSAPPAHAAPNAPQDLTAQ